jgi:hypothetical protein
MEKNEVEFFYWTPVLYTGKPQPAIVANQPQISRKPE